MSRLQHYWLSLISSFWFVPALIVAGMMLLAVLAIELETHIGRDALDAWPRVFGAQAQGSRSLLAAIAGSMITVAGTVFSITLVALSLTASQYSSRVLRTFISNRSTQVVLGVFVGVFAYSLLVLRVIRGGDEGAFVPSIAVVLGVALGLAGVGVLVFFIHHISAAIQASHIVERAGRETLEAIDRLFPADRNRARGRPADVSAEAVWQPIASRRDGYLQSVETARLLHFASRHEAVVRVEPAIGTFVLKGQPLLSVLCVVPVDRAAVRGLRRAFAIGRQRSLEQDIGFGLHELVDVALKALSPGINDQTTAVMCIDRLAAVLRVAGGRTLRFAGCSENGIERVQIRNPDFAELVSDVSDELCTHARGNPTILERLLWLGEQVVETTREAEHRQAVRRMIGHVRECAGRCIDDPLLLDRVARRADVARQACDRADAAPRRATPGG